MASTQRVLGIEFFNGSVSQAVDRAMQGGLTLAPSAPGLAMDFMHSATYRRALLTADTVITDSGFMVLLWRLRTGGRLPKNSGLAFLRQWVSREQMIGSTKVLWVMPSREEANRAKAWFGARGIDVDESLFYVAPYYRPPHYHDQALVALIERLRPQVVMVGVGGGVQECLGMELREKLSYRPTILCVGAAIAFLTGGQTRIPVWADKCGLGWLIRIIHSPRQFWRRYYDAFALAPVLWKYCGELPLFRGSKQ